MTPVIKVSDHSGNTIEKKFHPDAGLATRTTLSGGIEMVIITAFDPRLLNDDTAKVPTNLCYIGEKKRYANSRSGSPAIIDLGIRLCNPQDLYNWIAYEVLSKHEVAGCVFVVIYKPM